MSPTTRPKRSAGIFLHRQSAGRTEVLLVHPGGPFWAKKDTHGWSIPKGEFDEGEDPLEAARREFTEELGHPAPEGPFITLDPLKTSGKVIHAFAAAGDLDPDTITSNTFEMEWPPRSGRRQEFPEVDRAAWYDLETACTKLHKGQVPLIERFIAQLANQAPAAGPSASDDG